MSKPANLYYNLFKIEYYLACSEFNLMSFFSVLFAFGIHCLLRQKSKNFGHELSKNSSYNPSLSYKTRNQIGFGKLKSCVNFITNLTIYIYKQGKSNGCGNVFNSSNHNLYMTSAITDGAKLWDLREPNSIQKFSWPGSNFGRIQLGVDVCPNFQ